MRIDDTTGITVMSLKEYLTRFWPKTDVLHELLTSLKGAILEEDLENQTQGSTTSKKSSGGTGFQEVSSYLHVFDCRPYTLRR